MCLIASQKRHLELSVLYLSCVACLKKQECRVLYVSYSFPEKAGVKGSLSVMCNLPEKARM